jgi:hypothetical protein
VAIIAVNKAQSTIKIKEWELGLLDPGKPCIRSNEQIPVQGRGVTINPDTITGAPLVLKFQKIFLPSATPPEGDLIFTAGELSTWAADIYELEEEERVERTEGIRSCWESE